VQVCPFKLNGAVALKSYKDALVRNESRIQGARTSPASFNPSYHGIVDVEENKRHCPNGNAFVVHSVVLTAKHVVPPTNVVHLRFPEDQLASTTEMVQYRDLDLAWVDKTKARLNTVKGYKAAPATVGEACWVISYKLTPDGRKYPTMSPGFVIPPTTVFREYKGVLSHTCNTDPGDSGCPVFNEQGLVIGVHTHGVTLESFLSEFKRLTGLNFDCPAATKRYIEDEGLQREIAAIAEGRGASANAFVAFTPQMVQDFRTPGTMLTH
jgi:hypothetical protein